MNRSTARAALERIVSQHCVKIIANSGLDIQNCESQTKDEAEDVLSTSAINFCPKKFISPQKLRWLMHEVYDDLPSSCDLLEQKATLWKSL